MVTGKVFNHNVATALLRGLILRPSGFADLTIYGAFDYLRNFDWALHWASQRRFTISISDHRCGGQLYKE